MGNNIKETPKDTSLREFASFEPSSMKIGRAVLPLGELPKSDKLKKMLYYTYFPKYSHERIWTKFCTAVGIADVIT